MTHFATQHRNLLSANFTCPACIGVQIFTSTTFQHHWDQVHDQVSSLMMVMTETSLHSRVQQGFILNLFFTAFNVMPRDDAIGAEPNYNYSAIGGYAINMTPEELGKEVVQRQLNLLPHQDKPKPASTSTNWQQVVAGNRKRNPASLDEPSTSSSQRTTPPKQKPVTYTTEEWQTQPDSTTGPSARSQQQPKESKEEARARLERVLEAYETDRYTSSIMSYSTPFPDIKPEPQEQRQPKKNQPPRTTTPDQPTPAPLEAETYIMQT